MSAERSYNFIKAIEFTLPWEAGKDKKGNIREDGGLNNDDGSWTKWGIRQFSHPTVDIESLTKEDAIAIYKKEYWDIFRTMAVPSPVDLDELAPSLAVAVFDFGVNSGPARAYKYLTQARQGKPETWAKKVVELREGYMFDLVTQKPEKYKKQYNGWLNRTRDLKKYIEILNNE